MCHSVTKTCVTDVRKGKKKKSLANSRRRNATRDACSFYVCFDSFEPQVARDVGVHRRKRRVATYSTPNSTPTKIAIPAPASRLGNHMKHVIMGRREAAWTSKAHAWQSATCRFHPVHTLSVRNQWANCEFFPLAPNFIRFDLKKSWNSMWGRYATWTRVTAGLDRVRALRPPVLGACVAACVVATDMWRRRQ